MTWFPERMSIGPTVGRPLRGQRKSSRPSAVFNICCDWESAELLLLLLKWHRGLGFLNEYSPYFFITDIGTRTASIEDWLYFQHVIKAWNTCLSFCFIMSSTIVVYIDRYIYMRTCVWKNIFRLMYLFYFVFEHVTLLIRTKRKIRIFGVSVNVLTLFLSDQHLFHISDKRITRFNYPVGIY